MARRRPDGPWIAFHWTGDCVPVAEREMVCRVLRKFFGQGAGNQRATSRSKRVWSHSYTGAHKDNPCIFPLLLTGTK
jgi:hypothetical protein